MITNNLVKLKPIISIRIEISLLILKPRKITRSKRMRCNPIRLRIFSRIQSRK